MPAMLTDLALMEMHGAVSLLSSRVQIVLLTRGLDFSHEMSRSRAYRWGEDGIAGVSDTHGLQNIAFAFWNEKE